MIPGNVFKVFVALFVAHLLTWAVTVEASAANIEAAKSDPIIQQALEKLAAKKKKEIAKGVEILFEADGVLAKPVLTALLEGQLYRRKADNALMVLVEKQGKEFLVHPLFVAEKTELIPKKKLKRVGMNNKLRKAIRGALAKIDLSNEDASERAAAIRQLLPVLNDESIALIESFAGTESDQDVKYLMSTASALYKLDSGDKSVILESITELGGSLEVTVKNKLVELSESEDREIKASASKALKNIESKVEFYEVLEMIFFGLSLGSVLVLAAIGLAITFGVMGVINMAHGELIMLGAYTTYVIQLMMPNSIALSIFVAIPAAFIVAGLAGIAIERGVIRFLYGRPLETLLATFGVSLILQQLVRSIFSPLNRSVETPDFMSGSLEINPVFSITLNRLYILIFCFIVFALLFLVLKKTILGLQVRAVSQNRSMARAMGVKSEWVDALTFGLGSGVAGVAGVALSQLTNVGPNLGQSYIIDSFMVVVFGGVGNLWGTLVAGMSLGVANKVLEPYSGAVLAKIFVLVFIILFIQKKPRGLFPQKGRAVED